MRDSNWRRRPHNKLFSYVVSWICIVLAAMMLLPIVIKSEATPLSAKVSVSIVLGVMLLLGIYSLVMELLDYLESKKKTRQNDEEELK